MDSGSEDEMQMAPAQAGTRRAAKENTEPATKPAKTATSTAKSSKAAKSKGKVTIQDKNPAQSNKTKRKALQDISNEVNGSDDDHGNDVEEPKDHLNDARLQNKTIEQPTKKGKGKKSKDTGEDVEEIPETQQDSTDASRAVASKKSGKGKRVAQNEIPETQPMDLDEEDDMQEPEQEPQKGPQGKNSTKGRSKVADTRGSGTVDDLTKKLELLQTRFNELKDVGVVQAETQIEKLQRLRRKEKQDAETYISSLKEELASQKSRASDDNDLHQQISDLKSQLQSVREEKKAASQSLAAANSEIKALEAKLSATRSHSAESNGKGTQNGGPARTILVGSEEAKREMRIRALKEDLYADLTGLIMRDVKRKDGVHGGSAENIYDCLQTGRNGALHFRLSVPDSTTQGGAGQNTSSYDEEEFTYTPMLDEKRDRDLIDMLPDYLTEEICFPRNNAAKFYARVADCLTKKVQQAEEDDDEKGEVDHES